MTPQTNLSSQLAAKGDAFCVGIIGAMDEEVALLKASIADCEEQVIAGYSFFVGSIDGRSVVLLKSGIGKVNAAIGTALLLNVFKPDCVINTGSAGGFDAKLSVGDVVVSSEVVHHDVDLTVFGYKPGQVPGQEPTFIPDEQLSNLAKAAIADVDGIKAITGLIATGDTFMNDPQKVADTRAVFPTVAAVEMEAAAIAQTCSQFAIPFIIIRSLSDIAGQESGVSFEEYLVTAAKNSADIVLKTVAGLKTL